MTVGKAWRRRHGDGRNGRKTFASAASGYPHQLSQKIAQRGTTEPWPLGLPQPRLNGRASWSGDTDNTNAADFASHILKFFKFFQPVRKCPGHTHETIRNIRWFWFFSADSGRATDFILKNLLASSNLLESWHRVRRIPTKFLMRKPCEMPAWAINFCVTATRPA